MSNSINDNNNYICIDFGTCNTVISYIQDNNICQITDDITGNVLIPTTLYFLSENINEDIIFENLEPELHYIIGTGANELFYTNKDHEYYFFQFKRFLGITSKSINSSKDFLSKYNLEHFLDEDTIYFYIQIPNSEKKLKITIIDLINLFFKALYKIIKNRLNLTDKIDVTITCPAYFHDLQRSQLKKAVSASNFNIFKMYNEPTAAAIYYIEKYNKLNESNKYIIYDLGGGTIDTTVIEYYSELNTCEVIDIDGNNNLGGIDIDNILVYDILNKYQIDKSNIKWQNKIKKCAEEIKIKLTYYNYHDIYLENVPVIKNNIIIFIDNLKISYSRHIFNSLINNIVDMMIEPIKNMYLKHNTNNIIFIGGPTQIPLLQNKVLSILQNINESNLNKDLYKTIVSQGGSILFKKISKKENFCLLDIIPMNIGISGPNNNLIIMIEKNSKIPINIEKTFTTSFDCQRSINLEVFEGNNNNCELNNFIGSYKIIGIPPLPKGSILIKLLFKISYNGILNIEINSFKNPNNNLDKNIEFKMYENIKLIPNIIAKNIFKKIFMSEKK